MVVFACNGCGDTLKKNAVEKHPFNCRRSISCMDCGLDFHGVQYQQHLTCITENEKYGGGNYVAPVNKGEVKQEAWLTKVREAIRTQSNMPTNVQKLLNSIISFDNIPRKKAKFEKFVVNSCREKNTSAVNQAWEVFESCIKSDSKPAVTNTPAAVDAPPVSNGQTSPETMAITEEKKKKRKSKDVAVEDAVMEESPKKKKSKDKSIVEEPVANGVEKKKKKKDKSFVIDTEPEPVEKKKKKKKKDAEEEEEEDLEYLSPKKKLKSGFESFGGSNNNTGGDGGDWACTCGMSNFADRRFCRGCREKNPTADDSGDWVCPKDSCGMSNFASRTNCRTCNTGKDGTPAATKDGDWSCSGCGFSNFASRRNCKKCNQSGDGGGGGAGGGGADGDWQCTGCGSSNFASRFKCRQCNTPNGGGGGGGGKPGDWNCASCSFSNFASRYNCKQCNEAKPAGAGGAGGNNSFGGKPGDWNCASCGFSNFASRYNCKQCNEAKPAGGGAGGGGGAPAQSGEWECSGCGFSNFASRFKCKQCFAGKDGGAAGGGGGGRNNGEDWVCNCGFSNFPSRTSCKSCFEKKNASIPEHRIGMSHMSFDTTEADIKEFFLPLEPESIKLLIRDGEPQGKANIYFKNHADAVKAMEKDQQDCIRWRVNLYLNSTESGLADGTTPVTPAKNAAGKPGDWACSCGFSNFASRFNCRQCNADKPDDTEAAAPAAKTNKITFDQGANLEDSLNETADDTMNETAEADESTSEKKKFKWDKSIKSCLKAADNKTMSLKKLIKALLPKYTEQTGEECEKSEIKEKLEQRLNKSSKFTLENGTVSM